MLGFLVLLGGLWTAPACEPGVCSCVGAGDAPSGLASSDAVFTARVLSVRDTVVGRGSEYGPRQMRRVTLRVDRAWKGVGSRTVVVVTGMGGGDCGFPFRRGKSYLVYAHGTGDGSLSAGICGRTAELARAAADLRALGEPARHWRR
ncbi:MAG TPA: hypothetical protein VGX50_00475 [Longimicrobium sp.]|nr:hypothetical protein [Longimicrobium sp.]